VLPGHTPKMLPTAKLALKMLLPSRGSNATCSQHQHAEQDRCSSQIKLRG
jgi:hypothetical protein